MSRDWDDLGENDTLIIKLQAIAMVLAYIKLFSLLQFFSQKIDDFITALSHSKNMLIGYTGITVIFLLAFSVGLNMAFGVQQFQFSSLPLTAMSLSELLFGNFDAQPLDAEQGQIFASLMLVGWCPFRLVRFPPCSLCCASKQDDSLLGTSSCAILFVKTASAGRT